MRNSARAEAVSRPGFRGHPRLLLVATLLVFAIDQASKLAAHTFGLGASTLNDTHPVRWWWVLPIFAVVAGVAPSRRVAIFSSFFLGGFLGNLVDQHFWPGGIPDFLAFHDFYWNLADICILMGLALLLASPFVRLGEALVRRRPRVAAESPFVP